MDLQYNLRRDTAKQLGLDLDQVERATRSLFEYVAEKLEEGQLTAVRLPYFGLFFCKPERVRKLIEEERLSAEAALLIPGLRDQYPLPTPPHNPLGHGIGLP